MHFRIAYLIYDFLIVLGVSILLFVIYKCWSKK